ncbi:MAG TPA: BatA and WFA domain-containing protein [Planctomycetota bacterium]|nr:BatA and WFA domain-containing protein [Planctomycetota bacterium]
MSFLWPGGLALGGILPLVVALYFLKLRRSPKVVSSSYLWRRAVDEYRVNRPFQRFQNQFLLWLQLLLLSILILAVSRPYVRTQVAQSGVFLFLLDHSASMNVREENGTRLEMAKNLIREAVRGKRASDQMMIVAFSDRAWVVAPLSSDRNVLLRAIDQVGPTERPTRLADAWKSVLAVAREFDRSDIYLVSDGGFGSLDALTEANALIHYIPIGKSLNNLGIVQMEARESAEDRSVMEVFAQVYNRRPQKARTRVEFLLNDRLVDAQDVEIDAGGKKGVIFRRRLDEGVVELRLPEPDDFPEDNRAWLALRGADSAKVLLVGEEDFFLRQVLERDPGVELSLMSPAAYAGLGGSVPASDLVVFDGVPPRALPQGTSLCLGCIPELEGFAAGSIAERPRIQKWDLDHPLTRFVNFSTLHVSKLLTGTQPPWMRSLLSSDQGTALAAGEQGGTRLVLARFPLHESDWPLRVSFPLFMSNVVRWAKSGDVSASEGVVRPGQPLSLLIPPGAKAGSVIGPDGDLHRLPPPTRRQLVYPETERLGVYRARWDGHPQDLIHVVNLLDPAESDIAVPPAVQMGEKKLVGKDERALVQHELTGYLLSAALVLLVLEWLYYQFRR